jgi:hypothetical protein
VLSQSPGPGATHGRPAATGDAARIHCFLADYPQWSAFWDKRFGVWCVAEDDPDPDLYAESSEADTVMDYIAARRHQLPAAARTYRSAAVRTSAGSRKGLPL